MTHALLSRAQLSASDINDLPDSAFGYIEPGGKKDASGKTVPRSLRHFPIHDAAHVRNALARAPQSPFGEKAMAKIHAAAKKFGIEMSDASTMGRSLMPEWLARAYDPGEHPHAPAGSAIGGQFVGAAAAKAATSAGKKPSHAPAKKHAAAGPKRPANGNLAYDPETGHGPGYGMKGGDPKVHQIQDDLVRLGFAHKGDKALSDGKYGPKTSAAVKAAQKAMGMNADGIATPEFVQKLAGMKAMPHRSALLGDVFVRGFDFDLETRGDGRTLDGYAAVFNHPTKIRDLQGEFEETILPGAFTRSIGERMPILQWDHGKDPRVGTVPIGSIQLLEEDSRGLHVRARLFDNPVVEPVRQAIEAKAIKGMSFRFGVPDGGDTWTRRKDAPELREIRDADVHELGPVAFPAYDGTSVSVRSLLAQCDVDERRALIQELAAELRLALDLTDLTGRSDAGSDDGGDTGAEPDQPAPPAPHQTVRQRLDQGALRARGIIK
jgi:HK97 family phage prohead protease